MKTDTRDELIDQLMMRTSIFQTEIIKATEYNRIKCIKIVKLEIKNKELERELANITSEKNNTEKTRISDDIKE